MLNEADFTKPGNMFQFERHHFRRSANGAVSWLSGVDAQEVVVESASSDSRNKKRIWIWSLIRWSLLLCRGV